MNRPRGFWQKYWYMMDGWTTSFNPKDPWCYLWPLATLLCLAPFILAIFGIGLALLHWGLSWIGHHWFLTILFVCILINVITKQRKGKQ